MLVEFVKPHLMGENPQDIGRLWWRMWKLNRSVSTSVIGAKPTLDPRPSDIGYHESSSARIRMPDIAQIRRMAGTPTPPGREGVSP